MVNIRNITSKEQYEEFINNNVIVKFSADWCGPCRLLEKNIINLDENKIKNVLFGEINVDDDFADEITSSLGIRNIPVTIFFKEGKEIKRLVGLKTSQDLYNEINDAYS